MHADHPQDDTPFMLRMEHKEFKRKPYSLNHYARDIYSQCGEDGIIEHIFIKLRHRNKYAVEFGAWDGIHYSNTFNLIQNNKCSVLMIEGSAEKFKDLEETARKVHGKITPVNGIVGIRDYPLLDTYLQQNDAPEYPDLLSIDVDGIDYHIWASLKNYHPRVVVIEYNPTIPNDVFFVQAANEYICEGSSAAAIVELAAQKGYQLAAVTLYNLIFVVHEEFHLLHIEDNSLASLRETAWNPRIFYGQNGRIFTIGMHYSIWHPNVTMKYDSLQILSKFEWGDSLHRT